MKQVGIVILICMVAIAVFGYTDNATQATSSFVVVDNSATYYCDAVTFQYNANFGVFFMRVSNVDAGNTPVSVVVSAIGDGAIHNVTIPLNTTVPEGTTLQIQYGTGGVWSDAFQQTLGSARGDCTGLANPPEAEEEVPGWRRYDIGDTGALLALFVIEENNGAGNPILAFYCVDTDGEGIDGDGELAFYISAQGLAEEYPNNPEVNTLIAQDDACSFQFHKLTSGNFQVTVGPDNNGTVHVFIFEGVPPGNIHRETFNIADVFLSFERLLSGDWFAGV